MRAIHHRVLAFAVWALVAAPASPSPAVIDRAIRIQPIQVCSDDGTVCANSNRVLFEAETLKVWAQAGIRIEFLPWRHFNGTAWLNLSTSLFADYTIYSLANTPGHEQHPDPTVINLYFVSSFSNGAYGHSWQTQPGVAERNGIGIADNSFSSDGGGRRDVIAHELGHNLGLDHDTFGPIGATNVMAASRVVPSTVDDIFPDGSAVDFLNGSQISQARSTSYSLVLGAPTITRHPTNQVVRQGSNAVFEVVADGVPPLSFRWWFNETNLLETATNGQLVVSGVRVDQGGAYRAVISNSTASVTSEVAILVVADADTDGDGIPGGWEWDHGLNPHFSGDAVWDNDGDGMINLDEYLAHTDPNDPQSNLRVSAIPAVGSNGVLAIAFEGKEGLDYAVQSLEGLPSQSWQTLTNLPPLPTDQRVTVLEPWPPATPERWYRVVTPAQP